MKLLYSILFFLLIGNLGLAQSAAIHWLTWEEALAKNEEVPRKIFVDIYTDWCGWCKKMDATTFDEAYIAAYINENFYAVKFDAEQTEPIVFDGVAYKFTKQGRRGYHDLAALLTRGKLSYPTLVFLDENLNIIQPIPGYRDASEMEMMLTYFGYNMHKEVPWSLYQKNYQPLQKKATKDR